jgi:hypothetical protein
MDNQRVHYISHCLICSFSYQNDRLALNHLCIFKFFLLQKLEHLKITFLTINIFFSPTDIFHMFTVACLILSFHIVNIFSALVFGLGMTKKLSASMHIECCEFSSANRTRKIDCNWIWNKENNKEWIRKI